MGYTKRKYSDVLRADLFCRACEELTVLVTGVRKEAGRGTEGGGIPSWVTPACVLNKRAGGSLNSGQDAPAGGLGAGTLAPALWQRGRTTPGSFLAYGGLCCPIWELITHSRGSSQNTATSSLGPRSQNHRRSREAATALWQKEGAARPREGGQVVLVSASRGRSRTGLRAHAEWPGSQHFRAHPRAPWKGLGPTTGHSLPGDSEPGSSRPRTSRSAYLDRKAWCWVMASQS